MPRGVYDHSKAKPRGYWNGKSIKAKRAYYYQLKKARLAAKSKGKVHAKEIKRSIKTAVDPNEDIYQALAASGMILITDASELRGAGKQKQAAIYEAQGKKNLILARKLIDQ